MSAGRVLRLLRGLWPWRYLASMRWLARGVRVNPSSCFVDGVAPVRIGTGSAVGARCRFEVGGDGRIEIDERVWIAGDVEFETSGKVEIGTGTTIQRRCTVNGDVRIGAGCIFAPNVFVSSGTHPFRLFPELPIREQERRQAAADVASAGASRAIWIQDDCWLGVNVVVCPGVVIGKGSVVGANAVVTRDIRPYSVVAGAPARPIGNRLDWRPGTSVRADRESDQIYRLSGKVGPSADAGAQYFEADAASPLCVALSCPASAAALAIHWQAPTGVEFEAGGQSHRVPAGSGVLEMAADVDPAADGVYRCWVRVTDRTPGAVLRVSQVSIEAAGSL